MNKILAIAISLMAFSLTAKAQTNSITGITNSGNVPQDIIATIESAVTQVNTNSAVWKSNLFTIYEGAAFASVANVPGQSSIGNDLGVMVPVYTLMPAPGLLPTANIALDSGTRFESVFGNVAHQQFGAFLQYNYYNIKLGGGIDGRYRFTDRKGLAVPGFQVDLNTGPIGVYTRWDIPIEHKTGFGELIIGAGMPFGKNFKLSGNNYAGR